MTTDATPNADPAAAPSGDLPAELLELRGSIDNIDAAIVHMLAERFRCTQRVGALKATHRLPPADPGREARQVARLRALAATARLDPEFAEKYLAFVVREVIRHHEVARDAARDTAGPVTGTATGSGRRESL